MYAIIGDTLSFREEREEAPQRKEVSISYG